MYTSAAFTPLNFPPSLVARQREPMHCTAAWGLSGEFLISDGNDGARKGVSSRRCRSAVLVVRDSVMRKTKRTDGSTSSLWYQISRYQTS